MQLGLIRSSCDPVRYIQGLVRFIQGPVRSTYVQLGLVRSTWTQLTAVRFSEVSDRSSKDTRRSGKVNLFTKQKRFLQNENRFIHRKN